MDSKPFQFDQDGWTPSVYTKIGAAVERSLRNSTQPPVAVFDFDQTCIFGDIGELFSHFLIDEMAYHYELEQFWQLIDPRDGRDRIRALVNHLETLDPAHRRESEAYREYLAEMGAVYSRKYRREGPAPSYEWAVRLHVGMTPDEIHQLSLRAIKREIQTPIGVETRQSERGDSAKISRGLRIHTEMRKLIVALKRAGFDVWIVSATNRWTVETFASYAFNISPERVLGNQIYRKSDGDQPLRLCEAPGNTLGSTTCLPVLYRQGKVDIIRREIGRRPALAFGDTTTDFEMLANASELAVLVDRGNAELRREAKKRDWALQPQDKLTRSAVLSYQNSQASGDLS